MTKSWAHSLLFRYFDRTQRLHTPLDKNDSICAHNLVNYFRNCDFFDFLFWLWFWFAISERSFVKCHVAIHWMSEFDWSVRTGESLQIYKWFVALIYEQSTSELCHKSRRILIEFPLTYSVARKMIRTNLFSCFVLLAEQLFVSFGILVSIRLCLDGFPSMRLEDIPCITVYRRGHMCVSLYCASTN